MADGRKGRSDKGKYRQNKVVEPLKPVDAERVQIPEVDPLYHTYDQAKPEGSYFDDEAADHAVDWIESNVRHYKAEWAGQPFYLLDWQQRLVRHIFGWKRPDGYRLFRRVFVMCPRKAGKTTLAAAIAEYLAFADGENASQVVFAAHTKDQAGICFNAARIGIEQNVSLKDQVAIYKSPARIEFRDDQGASWLKPVANDSQTAQGLEVHGLVFDELAQVKNRRELWTALTKGSATRRQPLLFAISTADYERVSLCFEQFEKTRQIMEGTVGDPRFLGVVYGAPMDADWTDPETWRKANPSYGAAVHQDAYEDEYNAVKANPAEQNEFRIFQLSQWVGQAERYISMESWKKGSVLLKPAKKRVAFGGLDLSATTDLSAFSVVSPNEDGSIDLYTYPFIPTEGPSLQERMKRDGANYDLWSKEGYLELCEGPVIDQGAIKRTILQAAEAFDLRDVGLDRHYGDRLKQELEDEGITMVPINQGFAGMSSPTKEFNSMILKGLVHHGSHPVLQWSVDHFTVKRDSYGNVMPDKMRAQNRIDPVAASIMAFDGWDRRGKKAKKKSAYKSGGFYDQFLPKETAETVA